MASIIKKKTKKQASLMFTNQNLTGTRRKNNHVLKEN